MKPLAQLDIEDIEKEKRDLLMLAETVGRIQNELQWIIEHIRTKADELGVEVN